MTNARRFGRGILLAVLATACQSHSSGSPAPVGWLGRDAVRYLDQAQLEIRTKAVAAVGDSGAVTVAYGPFAARAGLAVLQHGGNAMDAALTTAVTQVAVTAGAPVSYFGIMALVYYDAKSGRITTMNAGWNTIKGDTDPLTIPGSIDFGPHVLGTAVSGRTALVGGFLKGVESAHRRFGKLPWKTLFEPAIWVARRGMPVNGTLAHHFEERAPDLARLPATRAILLKPDGSPYREGETFRQPALARTLEAIAGRGADYMYRGPWADRLVAAVLADGGRMTREDLAGYDVIWSDPLVARVGDIDIATLPVPNDGGVALIEAQQLALAAGLGRGEPWSRSGATLKQAMAIALARTVTYLPDQIQAQRYPGVRFDAGSRVTAANAQAYWPFLARGDTPMPVASAPKHSDDVVVIDAQGNMAAITHSINCVFWGKTAINIDGISIGDPGSYQQALIAKTGPGKRLPDPTETGIVLQAGTPVLAFASMGSGLHERTLQGLVNVFRGGMTVDQAIDAPDFFIPSYDAAAGGMVLPVPAGRFPLAVLEASGVRYREITTEQMRLGGEGTWIAISRDPVTRRIRASSNNRNNSTALAY